MNSANEEDVVIAFRQAVEEELRKVQSGKARLQSDILAEGGSLEEIVRRLIEHHYELEREVALLRTVMLRLVSDPVDAGGSTAQSGD